MINILNYIFGLSLLIVSSYSLNSDGLPTSIRSNSGCVVPTTIASSKGFNVKYYSKYNLLPRWSAVFSSTYIYKDYTTLTPVSSAHAVQGDIDLEYAWYPRNPGILTTWGMVFDGSSFLAEFTTYFKPTETGFYQFFWEDVDNAIMLFIGEDAFSCCDGTADPSNTNFDYLMWITNQMQNQNVGSDYFYFEADILYPVRIIYINEENGAKFIFKVVHSSTEIEVADHLYLLPETAHARQCEVSSFTYTPVNFTTTVPCFSCSVPVTVTTETVITTGTAPVTVPEVVVSTPVSTLTSTVPCASCTAPVTITTETVITTGTTPQTVEEVIVSTPVSTLTTIVPCASCTAPVTVTTETVITTGTAPVTVPEVIIQTPISTLTTTVPCANCIVPITDTLTTVINSGSTTLTEVVVIISAPPIVSFSFSSSANTVITSSLYFSNSSVDCSLFDSFSTSLDYMATHIHSFGSTTDVAHSSRVESRIGYVTLTSALTEATLPSLLNSQTVTTVHIISVTESLSQTTKSLLTRAVTTTDVKTIKETVSCSSTSASESISTPESLVGSKSTISYASKPTASGLVSGSFNSFIKASITAEGHTTLESQDEYFTPTSILSAKSSKLLTTPYEGQTQAALVSGSSKSEVFLSSSSSYISNTEVLTEYTDGSAGGKSNSIFKYLSAVVCAFLFM